MWQWCVGHGSLALDGGPKPRQRVTQGRIVDAGQGRGERGGRGSAGAGRPIGGTAARQRGLANAEASHRAPAEIPVHPFQDHRREMLHLDRGWTFDPQHQRRRLRLFVPTGPRPLQLDGFRKGSDLRADDLGPVGDQFARGKTLAGEYVAEAAADKIAERLGIGLPGLVHRRPLCHRSGMKVAAKRRGKKEIAQRRPMEGEPSVPAFPPPQGAPQGGREQTVLGESECPPSERDHGSAQQVTDARPNAEDLLAWYDRHRRRLPWRAAPGETADPYRVWLSEIMLQQTTVNVAAPYYLKFLARWPDVAGLAAASLDNVLGAWAGLGYYA